MSDEELPRILCVDDEPRVLAGLENNLGWDFDCVTAGSGALGLEVLRDEGPFAVVISDMRMPGMDGATFLAEVRRRFPDATRMLLTGQADTASAIAAINDGQIFRFLCKPCPADELVAAVRSALRQYELVIAERTLLQDTLAGAVKTLTDVLGLAAPTAFRRGNELKSYVSHMADALEVPNAWQYGVAALLAELGCITLPPDVLDKVHAGRELTREESRMFEAHPAAGHDLLAHVPRMGNVATMILQQHRAPRRAPSTSPSNAEEETVLGAAMLNVAHRVAAARNGGTSVRNAAAHIERKSPALAGLAATLSDFAANEAGYQVRAIRVAELIVTMVLEEDIVTVDGNVLVGRGRKVDRALIERIHNFSKRVELVQPFHVRAPAA